MFHNVKLLAGDKSDMYDNNDVINVDKVGINFIVQVYAHLLLHLKNYRKTLEVIFVLV
jgi:hypothetical protein